jgi:hypothetical protein
MFLELHHPFHDHIILWVNMNLVEQMYRKGEEYTVIQSASTIDTKVRETPEEIRDMIWRAGGHA